MRQGIFITDSIFRDHKQDFARQQEFMMRNSKLKTSHPVVLFAAIALTVLSIVGSIAIADLIPAAVTQTTASDTSNDQDRQQQPNIRSGGTTDDSAYVGNSWIAKVDFAQKSFSSAVKPKLTECFNCGVVVGIKTIPSDNAKTTAITDTTDSALKPHSGDLSEQQLDNYLDAHRKNARLIVLDESNSEAHNTGLRRRQSEDVYANETAYVVMVRMQNGHHLTVTLNTAPQQKIGDKVRIINERTITA